MRYELYEDHPGYIYRFVCQNNDLNKMVDFLLDLTKNQKQRYIIFDNERGHALGKTQNLSLEKQAIITHHLKAAKQLSRNR